MAIVTAVLVLGFIILVHELGHYVAARACGIRIERFSIGFGPVLLRWRAWGTEWVLSPILLGGYVRIAGMHRNAATEGDPGAYANAPAWKRAITIAAGPGANYLLAIAAVAVLAVGRGLSPVQAARAGVEVVAVITVQTISALHALIGAHAGGGVMGPVGIVRDLAHTASWLELTLGAVGVSLGVGMFNIIPVPPLDGGELLLIAIEAVRRRRLSARSVLVLKATGAVILVGVFAVLLVTDIARALT